ncbi:MAG: Gfo/Idh/MocA family oxidoreductase [Geminicoccaceae bacterium]
MKQVALIGLGMVAPTFVAALADLERGGVARLRGVHARNAERRRAFVERHDTDLIDYATIEDIALDEDVDFAILATPPDARLEAIEILARAGKPVLMEKPVERTVAAAEKLCRICEEAGVPLGIVLQHRMRPAVIAMRDAIRKDDLGPLASFEISVPWWRPQSYYDEPGRGTYRRDGGGVMISQAIHVLDLGLSFLAPVASVIAMSETTALHRMEGEDFVVAGLRLTDGTIGSFFATTAAFSGRGEQIHLHFARGTVALEGNRFTIERHDGTSQSHGELAATGSGANPMAFTHEWHRAVIADFAEAITAGRKPAVDGRQALVVHRVIEAIEHSARVGQRISLTA